MYLSVFLYLGPGMGGGLITAVFGFIIAIFLGLWAVVYYPLKRAWKNKKKSETTKEKKIE
ncbi:MAG: hypothetical protein VW955_05435 [Gammaproteobacteria bacterium]|jgi:hypothetical protein